MTATPYELVGHKCRKGHELQVLHSTAGHYVGTLDPEDGAPFCRITGYARKPEGLAGTPERQCMENQFCNGGCGCLCSTKEVQDS